MNEMFVVPVAYADGSGADVFKCECGGTWTAAIDARDHQARGCELPKAWDSGDYLKPEPSPEQKAAEKKARKKQEAELFRGELTAALEAARSEGVQAGLIEGYYQGLTVARDSIRQVVSRSHAWGNAERATAETIEDRVEELMMDAAEARP